VSAWDYCGKERLFVGSMWSNGRPILELCDVKGRPAASPASSLTDGVLMLRSFDSSKAVRYVFPLVDKSMIEDR
jgi:hypothetical protein